MDDITLDFDPRNAWFNTNVAFAQPQPQPMMGSFGPRRIPYVNYTQAPRPVPMVRPQAAAQPMVYLPPTYGPGAYPVPVPVQRRRLSELTVGDLLPLVALGLTALRSLPAAPTDARDTDTNLVNQTKFLAAIAQHFKADAQLNAVGTIAGKLIG